MTTIRAIVSPRVTKAIVSPAVTQVVRMARIGGTSTGFPNAAANTVLAGPVSGAAAQPAARALVSADMPASVLESGDDISLLTNNAGYITAASAPVQSVAGRTGAITLTSADVSNTAGYVDAAGAAAAAPVQSVAGRTGTVTLTSSDVGLGNVPNVDATNATNISSGTLPVARLADVVSRVFASVSLDTKSATPATVHTMADGVVYALQSIVMRATSYAGLTSAPAVKLECLTAADALLGGVLLPTTLGGSVPSSGRRQWTFGNPGAVTMPSANGQKIVATATTPANATNFTITIDLIGYPVA